MKKQLFLISLSMIIFAAVPVMGMQDHGSHGSGGGHNMQSDKKMDHGGMGGTFKHTATEGGIEAAFQVMSLASMNMTSDEGDTHHIMVNLKEAASGAPIKNAIGKIKVIAPDKTEQISPLKNYSGILAANFTFDKPGKYGVICLLKESDKKQVFKFWYHHM